MILGLYAVDAVRLVVLAITIVTCACFPAATYLQGRHWSAFLAVIGCELLLVTAMGAITEHWGQPLVWYRTPMVLIADALILAFVYIVARDRRRA